MFLIVGVGFFKTSSSVVCFFQSLQENIASLLKKQFNIPDYAWVQTTSPNSILQYTK